MRELNALDVIRFYKSPNNLQEDDIEIYNYLKNFLSVKENEELILSKFQIAVQSIKNQESEQFENEVHKSTLKVLDRFYKNYSPIPQEPAKITTSEKIGWFTRFKQAFEELAFPMRLAMGVGMLFLLFSPFVLLKTGFDDFSLKQEGFNLLSEVQAIVSDSWMNLFISSVLIEALAIAFFIYSFSQIEKDTQKSIVGFVPFSAFGLISLVLLLLFQMSIAGASGELFKKIGIFISVFIFFCNTWLSIKFLRKFSSKRYS